jgi:hypothetical protein
MQSLNVQSLPTDIAARTRALQSAIDTIATAGGGCLHLEAVARLNAQE